MSLFFVSARRRSSARGFASGLAMALALAGGAVVTSAAFAPAAVAQSYSREFRAAYAPVAAVTEGEMPNWASARDQYETVFAAIMNEDDRHAAGSFALQIGNNLSDPVYQRRGLELMLASGKTPPEQIGMFNFFVGNLAYNAGDHPAARAALQAALDAGYTENDPRGLIIESYFQQELIAEGLAFMKQQADALVAAGGEVPEIWLLRGLQRAYDADKPAEANEVARMLVHYHPTQQNWVRSLQVVNAVNPLEAPAQLDLYRLMRETQALTQRDEFIRYIEAADPRIMSNEVLPVLAEAVASGELEARDNYYVEVKAIADARAPQDRRDLEGLVREGRTGDGRLALSTGDLLWSVADFVRAEELYQVALDKGADRDTALTRLGMAQVKQGKFAEAQATLAQVGGVRAPVAQMWATYAASKAS